MIIQNELMWGFEGGQLLSEGGIKNKDPEKISSILEISMEKIELVEKLETKK